MNTLMSYDHLLHEYPEENTDKLRSGHATCVRYNRKGDYLATGRTNGTVVVWDLDTMGVARKLRGHCHVVSSVSWSSCGRYILSSCVGWLVILWDLWDGSQLRRVGMGAPIYMADLNPDNHLQFAAALMDEPPYVVDMSDKVTVKHVLRSTPERANVGNLSATTIEKRAKEDARAMTTAVVYTSDGQHVVTATSKGRLNLVSSKTYQILFSQKVSGFAITYLRVTQSGGVLLLNAQDRIIRTFTMPSLAVDKDMDSDTLFFNPEHQFNDIVNRMSWNYPSLSHTGDFVIASTYSNHELYLWERGFGSLSRMLVGPKEELGMIDWHPARAAFTVLGLETGSIFLWGCSGPQKWSALAPGFDEVEEFVEYIEREDEFDVYPKEDVTKQRLDAEDEIVDVVSGRLGDVDEFRMPVTFDEGDTDSEEELVEVSTGTMRRKSVLEDGLDDEEHKAVERKANRGGRAVARKQGKGATKAERKEIRGGVKKAQRGRPRKR